MKRLYDGIIAARSDEEAQAGIKIILAPLIADKAITQEQANEIVTRLADHPTREGLALDPRINLSKVKVPILAINGSLDLQEPASKNFPVLRQATAKNSMLQRSRRWALITICRRRKPVLWKSGAHLECHTQTNPQMNSSPIGSGSTRTTATSIEIPKMALLR